ncbi:unnamed protein product [Closterium sp. NIES-53]
MAKVTSNWYPQVNVADQAQTPADMTHDDACQASHLRAPTSVNLVVMYGAMLDGRFDAVLGHRQPALLAGRFSAALVRLLSASMAVSTLLRWQSICLSARLLGSDTMTPVPVGPGMVEDSLEARLADARRRHDAGEFRPTLPLEVVVMGIRAHRATDLDLFLLNRHATKGASTRRWTSVIKSAAVRARRREVWLEPRRRRTCRWAGLRRESIEPWLEITGLKGFADGDVPIPDADEVELRAEFHAAHFQTLMVTDDLYIGQLEEQLTHLRMGEQELAMDYCNRAQRILTEMWMAVVNYSTASYITHVIKGLPSGYNLMRQMLVMPGMWDSLDEDTLTSHIIKDEAMQEAERPTGLFPQANYIAPTKQSRQQGQRGKPRGAGSGVGRSTKDDDQAKSSRDKGRGGGG